MGREKSIFGLNSSMNYFGLMELWKSDVNIENRHARGGFKSQIPFFALKIII